MKAFPTKTKTNFMVCFELVKPEEFLMRTSYPYTDNREKIIKNKVQKLVESERKTYQGSVSQIVKDRRKLEKY